MERVKVSKLFVNIDHVGTVRKARLGVSPDPLWAAVIVESAGASGITAHLREDRRHINDRDMALLREIVKGELNMEMAATDEMIEIATNLKPHQATLVPERRQELTTEGGLDVAGNFDRIKDAVERLKKAGIRVSLFVEAEKEQIKASREAGADYIELHTGRWADTLDPCELERLCEGASYAFEIGLGVNAGHGLDYNNTFPVALIPEVEDLNIGFHIIGRAIFVGLDRAVRDMLNIINQANILKAQGVRPRDWLRRRPGSSL